MHIGNDQSAGKSATKGAEQRVESTEHPALLHLASLLPVSQLTSANIDDHCGDLFLTESNRRTVVNILSILHHSRCRHSLLMEMKGQPTR